MRVRASTAAERQWTADEFMVTDQHLSGDARRCGLAGGRIVAHAAPAPRRGAILAGLARSTADRLIDKPGRCRPESAAAAPSTAQRDTARLDLIVRCGELPAVAFEIVPPAGIRDWRGHDLKRCHAQAVEGARGIVEIYRDGCAAHVHRARPDNASTFEAIGVAIPLAEICAFVALPREGPAPEVRTA